MEVACSSLYLLSRSSRKQHLGSTISAFSGTANPHKKTVILFDMAVCRQV
jgi:hypothetical protein